MTANWPHPPVPPRPARRRLTWSQGFRLYMRDPHAKKMSLYVLKLVTLLLPASVITTFILAFLGPLAVIDEVLFLVLFARALLKMHKSIEHHRNNPLPPQPSNRLR